jgi:putative ABC transport system permease protein
LWLRWTGRDLRARLVQVAAVAAIVALGTGVYAGLSSTSGWRRASYDASYAALRVHDLRVTLAQDTFVDGARLERALRGIDGVEDVQARLVAPVQVDASREGRTILVPGVLVGVDPGAEPGIDRLHRRSGRALGPDDAGKRTVVLDAHFAEHYGLPPEGTLRTSGNKRLEYVGHALSPEYFIVTGSEGTMNAQANFAVLFAPNDTVGELTGRAGAANDAVVRMRAGTDRRAAAQEIEQTLRRALPSTAATVTALDDERPYRVLYDDIRGDQRLFNIFALLVLGGAAFAAFNLVSRIVEAQRREIGIGMALGMPPAQLAIRPVLVGFEVAFLGAVFGLGVALVVQQVMLGVMREFFPLPEWRTPFEAVTYARGWIIGLTLPFLATLVPVVRAVRVEPVRAIRTGPTVARGSRLLRTFRGLTFGNTIREMPVRNVARAPRRTLLTALAIAAAIGTLVGVVGIVDSFIATIDRGEAAVLGTRPDRLTVGLSGFALRDSPELQRIADAPGVARAEPGLQVGGTMRHGDTEILTMMRLLRFDDSLWQPAVQRGSLETTRPGIVISEKAARDLGVGVGDEITLEHPRREGLGYRMVESAVPVEAIHAIPYRFVSFLDLRDAPLFNLDGVYNTVAVAPDAQTSVPELQRTLFELPGVGSVQPIRAFAEAIRDLLGEILGILRVIEGAVLVLAALIAFNSSAIGVDERAREHATMFAFGVPVRTVLRNVVAESVIVGVLGTAAGIVLGHLIVRYVTTLLLPTTLPDVLVTPSVSPATMLTAIVVGVIAVSIAPLFTVGRMRRMNIPATLRVVE